MPNVEPDTTIQPVEHEWFPHVRARVFSIHPVATDMVVVLLAIALPTLGFAFGHDVEGRIVAHKGLAASDLVAAVVFATLIFVRRRFPVLAAMIGAGAATVITAVTGARSVAIPGLVVLLFAMSTRRPRRSVLMAGGAAVTSVFVAAAVRLDGHWFTADSFAFLAWLSLALAVGDAARSRREYIASMQERAAQLEASREAQTRQRVVDERLRIARELHDAVAHHMTIMNVQAGVASHLLRDDPDAAGAALQIVRGAGRSVLGELSDLLNVLRSTDDTGAAPRLAAPSMRDFDALITSFRDASLNVRVEHAGKGGALPELVDLTAYRIIEEALTNANKYGDGNALVNVTCESACLSVTIVNHIDRRKVEASQRSEVGGHGIIGMRERVAAVRGAVTIGPSSQDKFLVEAHLPLDRFE